jgi:hypothetical protein
VEATPIQLRGLLIKIRGRLEEFDGEEGLHAGVEVEGLTGQARSDGLGLGVPEAVYRSQLITLGLLAALREGEVPGQVGIIHPVVTRPPIRFAEQPTVGCTGDGDPALMHHGVMPLAQQDQIIQVGTATHNPRHDMMNLQVPGLMAAGISAHLVSDHQCSALRLTHQTSGAAQRQNLAVLVDDRAEQRTVTGMPWRGSGFNRTDSSYVTHCSGWRRSRGIVSGGFRNGFCCPSWSALRPTHSNQARPSKPRDRHRQMGPPGQPFRCQTQDVYRGALPGQSARTTLLWAFRTFSAPQGRGAGCHSTS